MQKGIKFSEVGDTLVARPSGEIDHHIAKGMRESIDYMLFKIKPKALVLDFSEVRFMDSSGIGLIIGRRDVCESLNSEIHIKSAAPSIKRLLKLAGIEKLKGITVD